MSAAHRFLYLEDQSADVELVEAALAREYIACELSWVNGRAAFESALAGGWAFDLILADYHLPDIEGDLAMALARKYSPNVPFIFVSGSLGEEKAVECLRAGATDYVLKSHLARLGPVLRRALEEARQANARREAEAATQRVVALLRATLESTSEGILVTDLAGRVSTYNRKFMTLCGIPDYVMAPMEMDRVLGFLLDQFQDPEAFLTEARQLIPHPDGESRGLIQLQGGRVLEGCSRPNRVGEQALGRVFSFRDVTARDQATARFEAEADSRQSLLEAASMVGVVAWCLTRDRLLLSTAVEPLLSLDPEERPANLETLEALIHPEDRDRFHRVLERPRKVPFDLRMRKGDGWLWTRWALVRDPAGYRGVFMDITEQRQREERFAERTRAQGMAALVDSGVRSLRRILGQIQPPPGGFQKGNREALDRLEIFLDRSVLAARVDPDFSQPQDLGGLLAEFQGRTQPELGPDLDLQVELEPGLPRLPIHPDHLRQLLVNLVDNARAAVNGAGTIVVRAGSEPLSRIRPGLFLEVRDDGCGIPPGVRSRMFEPYFTTRDGADGLGLTMVKAIVDSYRGSVACQTSAGQGTSFKLLLPIN